MFNSFNYVKIYIHVHVVSKTGNVFILKLHGVYCTSIACRCEAMGEEMEVFYTTIKTVHERTTWLDLHAHNATCITITSAQLPFSQIN